MTDLAPESDDDLLRIGQAAALLGVSVRSFEAYVRVPGLMPSYIRLPGGHRRWRRRDVLALVDVLRRNAK